MKRLRDDIVRSPTWTSVAGHLPFNIYSRPGVANACLKLQNEAGVDVMMFLMVAYAAVRHRIFLTASEIRTLDETCRPWREQIVQADPAPFKARG